MNHQLKKDRFLNFIWFLNFQNYPNNKDKKFVNSLTSVLNLTVVKLETPNIVFQKIYVCLSKYEFLLFWTNNLKASINMNLDSEKKF